MTIIGQSIDAIFVDMRAKEECKTLKIQLKHHLPVLEIPLHEINKIPQETKCLTQCK